MSSSFAPNVTDILHVGHALNNVIQDVLIRSSGCAAAPRSGCRGPITPVSRRRTWSRSASPKRQDPVGYGREQFVESVVLRQEDGNTIIEQLK